MKQKLKIVNISLYIITLLIGVAIGKLFDIPFAKLNKEVDPIQIISIGVTLWVAFIIATVLDREKDENNREKELILKRIEDLYLMLEDFNQKINIGEINFTRVTSSIKRINTSLKTVFNVLERTRIVIDTELKELQQLTRELNTLLTDTPIDNKKIEEADIPVSIKNSIIKLNNNRIIEIESKFDSLKNKILILQLEINKG